MTAIYAPLLKPLGITYPQYLVFLVLWEEDEAKALPCKVTKICEKLYLDTGTMTPLLKRMESSGYIIRERLKEDERVVGVCLTESGKALKEQAKEIPTKLLCNSPFSIAELGELKKMIDNLNCKLRGI
jgi:DNA-binding MarR family transcriptional regulator